MKPAEWWKNFRLGEELSVCGTFIYNGLRRFHKLHKLDHADDLFEVFYQLSIGLERLMKIAIVLLEQDDTNDHEAFEKSLETHNHQKLLARIQKRNSLKLSNSENAFLHLLTGYEKLLRPLLPALPSGARQGEARAVRFSRKATESHVRGP